MSELDNNTFQASITDHVKIRALERVLLDAQRIGALSDAPIAEVVAHSLWFANAIPISSKNVVDLGSGAGIPGLVVALARPDLNLTLVDRRKGRSDGLVRAVSVLGLGQRVSIRCCEITALVRELACAELFDAAISRGLGPPDTTLELSRKLVKPRGVIVISEPPPSMANRWNKTMVDGLGLDGPHRIGAVAVFHVKHSNPLSA